MQSGAGIAVQGTGRAAGAAGLLARLAAAVTRLAPLAVLAALTTGLTACGATTRALRAPRPDQTASIRTSSTTAATTTTKVASSAGTGTATTSSPADGFNLVAPWEDGEDIPQANTCKGDAGKAAVSPSVSWGDLPSDAVEVAITLVDITSDSYLNWAVTGIDPAVTGIADGKVPATAVQLPNGNAQPVYAGPCPNAGVHTYVLAVYALKIHPVIPANADTKTLLDLLEKASSSVIKVSGVVTAT